MMYARHLARCVNRKNTILVDITNGANHFCNINANPYWVKGKKPVIIIGKHKFSHIPLHTKNKITGKGGISRRQCTNLYKIQPVVQKVRDLLGLSKGEKRKKGTAVDMLMGISTDEQFRIKTNQIKYITNIYLKVTSYFSHFKLNRTTLVISF